MTKIHEEFIRGKVESIKSLSENLKGELTVVLSEKIKEKNNTKDIVEKEDEVHSEPWSILELPIISYFANYFKCEL